MGKDWEGWEGEGAGVADTWVCYHQKHMHPTKVANEEIF